MRAGFTVMILKQSNNPSYERAQTHKDQKDKVKSMLLVFFVSKKILHKEFVL